MSRSPTPIVDAHDAAALLEQLLARLPGYVPQWSPAPGGAGWAIGQVYTRYLQVLIERLNRAPDRNKLAFFDMLGLSLLPAQAAHAPVVFAPVAQSGDSRVPAHSRVGAKLAGRDDPLIFETESQIALAGASLAQVVSLWPGRDAYADHSAAATGGQPFTLFAGLQAVPHELYLAHAIHFAFAGQATVEIRFELSASGSEPLSLAWEYWDGEVWRAFNASKPAREATGTDSLDGTEGLTRSGVVRLVAACAKTERRKVNGIESCWVRARLTRPAPPADGRIWPQVARIVVRSVLACPLRRLVLASRQQLLAIAPTLTLVGGTGPDGKPVFDGRGTAELRAAGFYDLRTTDSKSPAVDWPALAPGRYHLRLKQPGHGDFDYAFTLEAGADLRLSLDSREADGIEAEAALGEGQKLDLSKAFFPFGQQPQAGSVFYLKCAKAFARPGSVVSLAAEGVATPQGKLDNPRASMAIVAEAWDGQRWRGAGVATDALVDLFAGQGGAVELSLPEQVAVTRVNDDEGYWLRFRISSGGFARTRAIKIDPDPKAEPISFTEYRPQALERLRLGYVYFSPQEPPQSCLAFNDFQWRDCSGDARGQGAPFEPFSPVEDRSPTLYLGFDRPLPADLVSLYLDVEEAPGDIDGPALRWEYHDGAAWLPLAVRDETRNLALPGMVGVLWPGVPALPAALVLDAAGLQVRLADARDGPRFAPGDRIFVERDGKGELATVLQSAGEVLLLATPLAAQYANAQVALARLPRFGRPYTWIRARLQQDGDPRAAGVNGIYSNAVWASQVQSFENEVLGSGTGRAGQAQFVRNTPVLPGQVIEVCELEGERARVELPILVADLIAHGMSEADVRTVADRRTGHTSQVWVRWQERAHLFFSGPGDRHYVIERSRGRIAFGDDRHGRIPLAGRDNILARAYRAGGGLEGNVPAGALSQLLAGVLAKGVDNPRAAEGGADGEPIDAVLERGPLSVRHRRQALSADDYEALAREASPAVAVARALPTTDPGGRPAPGWVKLVIMPHSHAPRPQPSFGLRRLVHDYIAARMSPTAAGLAVAGPDYLEVGAVAMIAPQRVEGAGAVLAAVTEALLRFLHPLDGGPDGHGWPAGRNVSLSDVAALLESIAGVDYVETLELTLDNTPHGEVIRVPRDRIVVAGALRVGFTGTGG